MIHRSGVAALQILSAERKRAKRSSLGYEARRRCSIVSPNLPTRVGVHRKFICYPNLFGKSQTQNARQKFGFWIGDFGILGRVPGELPLGDFATVGRAQQQPQQPP